jgi:hypothetical protein
MIALRIARNCTAAFAFAACCTTGLAAQSHTPREAQKQSVSAKVTSGLLSPADLQKLIPPSVFFRGQSSTVQYRNAGGVRLPDGEILFAVKVDTGGYSTSIQERYQDYFVSEVAVQFADHTLPSGAYGVGFVGSNLLVMDLGGRTIFTVPSVEDAELRRPRPLQLTQEQGGTYRLYSGKRYVTLKPIPPTTK